jgi:hypothetical protein
MGAIIGWFMLRNRANLIVFSAIALYLGPVKIPVSVGFDIQSGPRAVLCESDLGKT